MTNTNTAHEIRWSVPYTLVSGYASNALVWARDKSDAVYFARLAIARGGCPAVERFGTPTPAPIDDACPYGRSHAAGPCSACTDS